MELVKYDDLRSKYSSPSGPVDELVQALVLPDQARSGIRYRDEGTAVKTASAVVPQEFAITWTTAVADKGMPATDCMVFLFRSALRNSIFYDHNVAASTWTYQWSDDTGSTSFGLTARSMTQDIKPRLATATSVYRPHGDLLFAGKDNGHLYMRGDRFPATTGALNFVLNAAPGVGESIAIQMYQWDGKTEIRRTGIAIVNPATTGTIDYDAPGGYFRLAVVNNTTTVTSTTIISTGTSPVYCHRPVPNITTLMSQSMGLRVLSNSALWRNTSSDLNAMGSIVAATVYPGRPWETIDNGYNFLTGLSTFKAENAKNGYYGFLLPEHEDDFEFQNEITQNLIDATLPLCSYDLTPISPYKAIAYNVTDANARSTRLDITSVVEYMTTDNWGGAEETKYTLEQWKAAILLTSKIPTDYTNKFHWYEIANAIGDIGPGLYDALIDIAPEVPGTWGALAERYLRKFQPTAKKLFGYASKAGKKRKGEQVMIQQ